MFERITTYLAEQFDFPKDSLHWDTTFKSLQLDSMDMVEMMMDMEEELGVDFDQNDMAELTTIGELADYIEKKLNEGWNKVALVGEAAAPCNLQSAIAGMNSHMRLCTVPSVRVSGVEGSVLRNGLP